ncbi:MAG: metallophosphoesterase family protein [Euryarchaeota archaeon]|nr:metallophosphoesterase family protein [Euryarchaeota archaeon]
MKLLLFSDIHGSQRALKMMARRIAEHGPDATLIAGDLTHFGPPEFVDAVAALPGRVLAVNGNCDTREVVERLAESPVCAIDRVIDMGGAIVVGVGWPPGAMELDEIPPCLAREAGALARDPRPKIILSHSPAHGYLDEPWPGRHIGSRALLGFARDVNAALVVTGHVHEAAGIVEGAPLYVNPGPAKDGKGCIAEISLDEVRATALS